MSLKKMVLLMLVLAGVYSLDARKFTIVNHTGGPINAQGSIDEAIYTKPLGQDTYTITKASTDWPQGTFAAQNNPEHRIELPAANITVDEGKAVTITLPDQAVRRTAMYGYFIFDFGQAPTYKLKTNKVIGYSEGFRISNGPVEFSKHLGKRWLGLGPAAFRPRSAEQPRFASATITPENNATYTVFLDGNDVKVEKK